MRCSVGAIRAIIDGDRELSAAYGTTGMLTKARIPQAPTPDEVLDREPDDMPPNTGADKKAAVNIVNMVDQAERELHMKSLKALGVHDGTLEKLRKLDDMASSTGAFIAIGLEKTHRLYYLAVIDLKTVADQIKERYLDLGADGKPQVSPDLMPFYYRNYIDAVKEFGRAYDLFIQGAAVILKIVSSQSDDPVKQRKGKLGFGGRAPRNITPSPAPPMAVPPNG